MLLRPPSKIDVLIGERTTQRRRRAIISADKIIGKLNAEGIEAVVIGSLADGRFMSHSDIDFMVFGRMTFGQRPLVEDVISRVLTGTGIEYDIVFEDDVHPECMEEFCRAKLDALGLSKLTQEDAESQQRDEQFT